MHPALQSILDTIDRAGIPDAAIAARVAQNNSISFENASRLVAMLRDGENCATVVAAAIIGL